MAFTNQTVSIAKTFEYYYQVPEYQRGYVWDEEKITEFLGAIQVPSKWRIISDIAICNESFKSRIHLVVVISLA